MASHLMRYPRSCCEHGERGFVADREGAGASAASLVLVAGVPLLHPEPQVFEAMLEGLG
jgi:hypothetical protein